MSEKEVKPGMITEELSEAERREQFSLSDGQVGDLRSAMCGVDEPDSGAETE